MKRDCIFFSSPGVVAAERRIARHASVCRRVGYDVWFMVCNLISSRHPAKTSRFACRKSGSSRKGVFEALTDGQWRLG
jgi:hypothetical protein